MKTFLRLSCLFLLSLKSFADTDIKICLQRAMNGSCIESMENGPTISWIFNGLKLSDLNPEGISYYTYVPKKIEVVLTPQRTKRKSNAIENGLQQYGSGIAAILATASNNYKTIELQAENVGKKIEDIKRTINYVNEKNYESAQKLSSSIPNFKNIIDKLIQDAYSKLDLEHIEQEDLKRNFESPKMKEAQNLNVGDIDIDLNFSNLEFKQRDELLTKKRSKLLEYKNKDLSKDTVDKIHEVSGQIQTYAKDAHLSGDNETASFGLDVAFDLVDFGLGLTPFVGDGLSFFNAISGKNTITGKSLTTDERIFEAVTGTIGFVSLGTLGGFARTALKGSKLFKNSGKLSKIFNGTRNVFDSARKYGLKTAKGTKVYAKLHGPLETLPNGLKAQRILEGADSAKIAVIGRKMPGVVVDTEKHLAKNGVKAEIFSNDNVKGLDDAWEKFLNHQRDYNVKNNLPPKTYLPHNEVVKTDMYKMNKEWARKLKDEGYTVIDLGDPLSATYGSSSDVARSILDSELKGEGMSAFYSIEKKILFGE